MEKHYGQIVEYAVRKNGYNITDLAEAAKVNRRTVYNWFQQKYLKKSHIKIIGLTIRHDFSNELPELFTPEDFRVNDIISNVQRAITSADEAIDGWKRKYIKLLEDYNEALLCATANKGNIRI